MDADAVAAAMEPGAVAAALDTSVLVDALRDRLGAGPAGPAAGAEGLEERLDGPEAEVAALRAQLRTFERCSEDSLTALAGAVADLVDDPGAATCGCDVGDEAESTDTLAIDATDAGAVTDGADGDRVERSEGPGRDSIFRTRRGDTDG